MQKSKTAGTLVLALETMDEFVREVQNFRVPVYVTWTQEPVTRPRWWTATELAVQAVAYVGPGQLRALVWRGDYDGNDLQARREVVNELLEQQTTEMANMLAAAGLEVRRGKWEVLSE